MSEPTKDQQELLKRMTANFKTTRPNSNRGNMKRTNKITIEICDIDGEPTLIIYDNDAGKSGYFGITCPGSKFRELLDKAKLTGPLKAEITTEQVE